MNICRQCFREKAQDIGFAKVRFSHALTKIWDFKNKEEENKAAQVCRHLTTRIFISTVPLKKSRFRCRLFFSIHSCSRCPLRARRFGSNHGRDSIYLSFPRWGMDGNGKNGTKEKRKGEIS